jgi:tRNA G46 methylase TrmB
MPDCPYCGEMHSRMMKCSAQRKAEAVKTALAVKEPAVKKVSAKRSDWSALRKKDAKIGIDLGLGSGASLSSRCP